METKANIYGDKERANFWSIYSPDTDKGQGSMFLEERKEKNKNF